MKKLLSSVVALSLLATSTLMTMPTASAASTTVVVNPASALTAVEWVKSYDGTTAVTHQDLGKTTGEYQQPFTIARGTVTQTSEQRVATYGYSDAAKGKYNLYNNDIFVLYNVKPKNNDTGSVTVSIPVEIEASDYYTPTFIQGLESHAGFFSHIHMTLTDNSVQNDTGVVLYSTVAGGNVSKRSNGISPFAFWNFVEHKGRVQYIEEGSYTLNLTIYDDEQYAGQYQLFLDDIRFVPTEPINVTDIGETRIEFEDIDTGMASTKACVNDNTYVDISSLASNGKIITEFWSTVKNAPYTLRIPINVKTAGTYNWETVMNKGNSTITVTCEGTTVVSTASSGEDASLSNTYINATYPMQKYSGKIALPQGVSVLELTVSGHSYPTFFADYFALESGRIDIEGETKIEMEDYASQNSCSQSVALTGASESKVLSSSTSANSTYITYSIPVNVKAAGYYDTEFLTSSTADGMWAYSGLGFWIDNQYIGDNIQFVDQSYHTKMTPDLTGGTYNMYKIKGSTVYLDEGNHTISMKARVASDSGAASANMKFSADYIKLTPASTVINIPTNSKKTFELEDYKEQMGAANANASEGNLLYHEWFFAFANSYDLITVPIRITEKGFYQFKLPMTLYASMKSELKLNLDDETILANSGVGNMTEISPNSSPGSWPMYMFETTMLLEPGTYELKLNARADHASGTPFEYLQKFGADYISVEMVDPGDMLEQGDNSLLINKSIGENVTGTAYAAFYMGGELVDLVPKTVENEDSVLFDIQNKTWKDYDRVSVFVWDDKMYPLCDEYTYENLPMNKTPFEDSEEEINVVFIGDSLYEAYGVDENRKFSTQVGKWFEEQYEDEDTTVNYYNKGAGGTTSEYSLARVVRDVVDLEPDVVFFGTTINDGSRDTTRNMESVIRTLQSLDNPPYIIMTRYPTRTFGGVPAYGKTIADHYGIPFIDATKAFEEAVANGAVMENLYQDGVHPNNDGHDIISDEIIDRLATGRYLQMSDGTAAKINANSGAIDITSADYFTVADNRVTLSSGWTSGTSSSYGPYVETSTVGETIKFSFTGNILAFNYGLYNDAAQMEVWVDGSLVFTCDPYYGGLYNHQKVCKETSAYFDLPDGTHNVEMKVIKSTNSAVTATTQTIRIYDILTGSWAD